MVTLKSDGEAASRRLRLHHVERRPRSTTCSYLPRRQACGEVGLGQQESHEGYRVTRSPRTDRPTRIRGFAMKIRSVRPNNRKKAFEVRVSTKTFLFPYSKTEPRPAIEDPVARVFVDREIGREGF